MGLETATFISGLNANNPVGATDPKSQGDDHLRLIKTTLLNTFPNISGVMNASHTELNNLVGITGKTGTGNIVLSASPTLTGTITGGTFSGNGSGLTALNASNISSGIIADARLSSNVPLKDGANVLTQSGSAGSLTFALHLKSSSPQLTFEDEDVTNTGIWNFVGAGTSLLVRRLLDDGTTGETAINFTGNSSGEITSLAFAADSITANGSEVLTATTGVLLTGNQTIAGVKKFSDAPVFSDGATVDGAFRLNNVVTDTSGVAGDGSTTQNYAPTGHADADVFRISVSGVAPGELGGLVGPQDGRVVVIRNLGPNALQLQHENTGSNAGNRFHLQGNASKNLSAANGSITLWYDGITNRWVEIAGIGLT